MKNEEAMANFMLKEAEIKESLRKRMSESVFDYYMRRYQFRMCIVVLFVGLLFYMSLNNHLSVPNWGLFPISIAMIALMVSKRNAGRVDAMIKLSAFENATNASLKASPDQQNT